MTEKFILEKSKDGKEILRIMKDKKIYYIGSKYNMEREINKFFESVGELTEKDTYIIFGIGSLLIIDELIKKKFKGTKIFLIDGNKELIKYMLSNSEYKEVSKKEDIKVIDNYKDIREQLNEIDEKNVELVKMLSFGNYNKIHSEELVNEYREVKDKIIEMKMNKNTRMFFEMEWLKNDLYNSKAIFKSQKIDELKNKYINVPAIIVSAGPSLEKNINDIDENKAYLISGGRTLKTLKEVEKEVDILTVIDGGEASYKLVEGYINISKSTLFYNEMTNLDVIKNHNGIKVVSSQSGIIKKMYNDKIEDIGKGGSVANCMAYVAGYLGFNPIIFVGQDLAYTNDKGHAEIASYNGNSVDAKMGYFNSSDVWVEDINGNEVRTSLVLKGFRDSMENIIELFPNTKFIDATEGGAKIKGTEIKKLKDVMSELKEIEKQPVGRVVNDIELKTKLEKYILVSRKKMKSLIELSEQAILNLNKFKKLYLEKKELTKINIKLDKIENKIKKEIKDLDVLNSLIYPFIFNLENDSKYICKEKDSEKERIEKKLNMNLEIYEGVIRMCNTALEEMKIAYKDY